ncbi:hypothetical protein [Kibdelosporangium phytohabitans]|uniref:Uncharacterized protein n=1 Tax=Kibdelosporangium phytohabitans TaxID=860235 RepID=A0A0N9I2V6_9PSEU|nr:hypothetical protein [Kibdelosporangium phytohabitans]ALG08809.1 hypothetical protein AOZ06_19500 [Kibdelosporangium phytohabitans]MBE1470051.1 hypothetical protein [Kibdelosporangium phytohabitans]
MTARRLLLLVVAAVLMSLVLTPRSEPVPPPSPDNETVAVEQTVVKAVPPIRDAGRPAADPGLLKVQSLAEMTSTEPVPAMLGEQDEDVPLVSRDAALPVADDRGPPAGQAVL